MINHIVPDESREVAISNGYPAGVVDCLFTMGYIYTTEGWEQNTTPSQEVRSAAEMVFSRWGRGFKATKEPETPTYCRICSVPKDVHKILRYHDHEFAPAPPRPNSEEIRETSVTGAQKVTKPQRFSLIPTAALNILAEMYGEGVKKYNETPDDPNWRKGFEWSKSYDALMRHATAFWGGEDLDPESGMPHMAAVCFNAFTLLTFMSEHPEYDDRYKKAIKNEEENHSNNN